MSRMKKLLLCSGTGLCVFIFLVYLAFAINSKKSKEKVDMLKNVDLPLYLSFDCPVTTGLYRTIYKREPSLLSNYMSNIVGLGDAFRKLKETGKAIDEEVEAVIEFEKATDDLSNAISKIGHIPSLYSEIRF